MIDFSLYRLEIAAVYCRIAVGIKCHSNASIFLKIHLRKIPILVGNMPLHSKSHLVPTYSIGHFINQPKSRTQFEITDFATMEEPMIEDIHKHNFYEILWTDNGKSTQIIDDKEYHCTPQTLFFISPGQIHYFEDWHSLEGGSVLFTEEFFLLNSRTNDTLFAASFLDNFYANPRLKLDAANYKEIRGTIRQMQHEHLRSDRSDTILQALLHIFIAQIQRCVDAENTVSISRKYIVVFKQFKRLLDEHFLESWTASDYADALSITQHHLNAIVKHIAGKTATEAIRARSLLEAKRYFTFTDMTISEVSSLLGFFDSSYFAKIFRAEEGISPLDFKNKISEKYRKR
jgi:AraC-like DNA-binding protein